MKRLRDFALGAIVAGFSIGPMLWTQPVQIFKERAAPLSGWEQQLSAEIEGAVQSMRVIAPRLIGPPARSAAAIPEVG